MWRKQLVEYPEDTVIVDRLDGGQLAQRAVAGEQRPVVNFGERQREAVGESEGRDPGLITERSLDAVAIKQFNP